MTAREIYDGSDGDATKVLYRRLATFGPIGLVAMNLFRAQKCSARAKKYRGGVRGVGSYRSMAYDRKQYSMAQLSAILEQHALTLGIAWGWKEDPKTIFVDRASWVLYVELPQGQVSFHSPVRGSGQDFAGKWDQQRASCERILAFVESVLSGENYVQHVQNGNAVRPRPEVEDSDGAAVPAAGAPAESRTPGVACDALTWKAEEDGKDYVACSEPSGIAHVRLVGLLLSAEAHLCEAHQRYVAQHQKEWANTILLDAATGKEVVFEAYTRERSLVKPRKGPWASSVLASSK